MLGVLKRRWKPKRAANANRITNDTNALETEKVTAPPPPRLTPSSVRQVHPVRCEEKAQLLAYEKRTNLENNTKRAASIDNNILDLSASPPPPYPKRASLESNPSPTYPLTPNICVEGGRIEFIKLSPDGDSGCVIGGESGITTPPTTPRIGGRITITRGLQTDQNEKFDEAKEKLENKILELETALELAQKTELKDKLVITKLQRQLSRREASQRDADRERRLRADSESRAKQALQEASRCRSRLKLLTSEFSRMEETVRSMLIYKRQAEQLRQEKSTLTIAFENRCQQYQSTITRLNQEIFALRHQIEEASNLSIDSTISNENAVLQRHLAEESRKQYERCLDDVANQVVRALVTQKGLKEEVTSLNNRIQELESQNSALTSMLVHQLRGETPQDFETSSDSKQQHLALEDVSPPPKILDKSPISDTNSQSEEIEKTISRIEKHLSSVSADSDVLDTRFSLEDKKRHQVLTKLWTELKGTECTPKRLIEALSAVDSALWVPPKRPISLNLQLQPILQATKYRRGCNKQPALATQSINSKSEEELIGNDESPESGNRDEGYSTMSSDVQTTEVVTRGDCVAVTRGLEDLKEATDETETETRLFANELCKDSDVFYIPINLLSSLKPRNSFPPNKDLIPFQHIMRSFSDSHLCIKISTAPSPCYTFSSPISSTPSILFLDITDHYNPLRRAKATGSLLGATNFEFCDDTSPSTWSSSIPEEKFECASWDVDYIQHWLRLDETRLQQQHRDLLELEYDRTELEDWSLSLSNEDVREQWKKSSEALTPGQISLATLPSIQENNALELEEDSNECLWNSSSYMVDHEGHELVALLMDTCNQGEKQQWPYAVNYHLNLNNSPDNSWSSGGSNDYCHSHEPETCSKRSSAALSGCSDDTGELPAIGTDFTRDFYRLVKFESTKSLASTSSRSLGGALSDGGAGGDRDVALQNVLTFIAEQQKYVQAREAGARPCSVNEITKEFNIEAPQQFIELQQQQPQPGDSDKSNNSDENYVTLKQLCAEFNMNELNEKKISYAEEVCLVTALDVAETENCSNISDYPVDICASINVEAIDAEPHEEEEKLSCDLIKSCSESQTSSVSTPETIISKIPRRFPSKIPVSPARSRIPRSQQKIVLVKSAQQAIITDSPPINSGVISNIIDGPPHRAVSFHERATSKDVIDELNRMIKNGDDAVASQEDLCNPDLDEACRSTGWIHVERDVDLTDPKMRASLLDVMLASVSSDSSPTSSCGGSITSESLEDHPPTDYGQLHRIHRFHRQKKANAARPDMQAVVRASLPVFRPSIIGRQDFFVRYGEKEKEAVASFDFLDHLEFISGCAATTTQPPPTSS